MIKADMIRRYFTRFTEEAFASLVGIIFIVESLKKIFSKFHKKVDLCNNLFKIFRDEQILQGSHWI